MIEKTVLPNGVRLVCERLPSVRTAAFGIWVGSGSRHEPAALSGVSHAIEHMVFKGTGRRSAAQLAAQMDAIGGQINAFTTKELTCFYGRCLEAHLSEALDLVCDIFFRPSLRARDWKSERGVILEEIGMYEDTPEDLVCERLFNAVFRGSPLGRPILGKPSTLRSLKASDLARYKAEHFLPTEIVVSLSGAFSQAHEAYLAEQFGTIPPGARTPQPAVCYQPAFAVKKKPIEQNHLCLAFPSLPYGHPDRHALQILSGILGGGMSSRLFQAVREQNGLCYSIYSFTAAHEDTGILGIYTALGQETETEALRLILEVVRELRDNGPDAGELTRTREQIKSNILMSLESTGSRMNHLGQHELLQGEIPTQDEIIARFDAVTVQSVKALAGKLLDEEQLSFSAVGQVSGAERYRRLLHA